MTPKQLMALGSGLTAYLKVFRACFGRRENFKHLCCYVRGLLSDLPRKTVEPIALACGTAVRTLQEFLRDAVWDHCLLRDLLQKRLAGQPVLSAPDDLGTIGIIDETSVVKKGEKTPGVQRQYCGELGKVENGIVTVHLAVVRGQFKTIVDADLFLPKSWSDDRDRCREARIPDELVYRPKWRIALEQLDRAQANGLQPNWLTFDEYYGGKPAYLEALEAQEGMSYIGEIPRSFRCLAVPPRGKKPKRGWKGKRADNLARFSSALNQCDWQGVSLARLTLAAQTWEVRFGQVYLLRRGELSKRTYWLIVARNEETGEVKYFTSNAPPVTAIETLLRVAFRRWHVEHAFRVVKDEIGFRHFEGRSYVALMRHLIISLLALGFVAEHTDRLRGEKSGDHFGAGLPGNAPALPGLATKSATDHTTLAHCRSHQLPPAA